MKVVFFDRQNESNSMNGAQIAGSHGLESLLDSLKSRSPFFFELIGQGENKLLVGISGELGCVQYSEKTGEPPYFMATKADASQDDQYLEFLIGDTPTPVLVRYCLPFDTVKQVALHFQKTGNRSPTVMWEEI